MTTTTTAATPRRRVRTGRHADRLDFKLPEAKKKMYQRAAEIAGESLTAFAVSAMDARAEAVIRAHDTTTLTPEESVTFIDLMRAPLAENTQLVTRLAELEAYTGNET